MVGAGGDGVRASTTRDDTNTVVATTGRVRVWRKAPFPKTGACCLWKSARNFLDLEMPRQHGRCKTPREHPTARILLRQTRAMKIAKRILDGCDPGGVIGRFLLFPILFSSAEGEGRSTTPPRYPSLRRNTSLRSSVDRRGLRRAREKLALRGLLSCLRSLGTEQAHTRVGRSSRLVFVCLIERKRWRPLCLRGLWPAAHGVFSSGPARARWPCSRPSSPHRRARFLLARRSSARGPRAPRRPCSSTTPREPSPRARSCRAIGEFSARRRQRRTTESASLFPSFSVFADAQAFDVTRRARHETVFQLHPEAREQR